jgi:cardiolipin synthase
MSQTAGARCNWLRTARAFPSAQQPSANTPIQQAGSNVIPIYISFASLLAALDIAIVVITVPWILSLKKEPTAATAWCLVVLFVPLLGALLFVLFGYSRIHRPLRRKRRHRAFYGAKNPPHSHQEAEGAPAEAKDLAGWENLGLLAARLGAFPVSCGNAVEMYHDTAPAMSALMGAIEDARHHVHVQFYIVQPDATGGRLLELLARKASEGVEVRLLCDAVGSLWLKRRLLGPLVAANGKCASFLGFRPWRGRVQMNLRNHRKITVVDGRVGFTGGMNMGDEYLGRSRTFGYWRDTHMRIQGPAVAALARIFAEDWHFASGEDLHSGPYLPKLAPAGDDVVQVVESGPDRDPNTARELLFAALASARERVWIATPYFLPDGGLFDAICLAARRGVDVRLLMPLVPDHILPRWAGRYWWDDLLAEGVRILLYNKGMMHAKTMIVDHDWGWVGSANFDQRSLRLNFESICVFHTQRLVDELEVAFLDDCRHTEEVDRERFARRSWTSRMVENGARLFAPVL